MVSDDENEFGSFAGESAWTCHFDEASASWYWFNEETGASRWAEEESNDANHYVAQSSESNGDVRKNGGKNLWLNVEEINERHFSDVASPHGEDLFYECRLASPSPRNTPSESSESPQASSKPAFLTCFTQKREPRKTPMHTDSRKRFSWSAVASPHQIRKRLRNFFSEVDPHSLDDVERYVRNIKNGAVTENSLFKQLHTVYGKKPRSKSDFYSYGKNEDAGASPHAYLYGGDGGRPRAVRFSTVVEHKGADGSITPSSEHSTSWADDTSTGLEAPEQSHSQKQKSRKRNIRRLSIPEKRHLYAFREDLRPENKIWRTSNEVNKKPSTHFESVPAAKSWESVSDPFLESVDVHGEKPRWKAEMISASRQGETERIASLVLNGCPVDAEDPESGETALTVACRSGKHKAAEVLLQLGASMQPNAQHCDSPFHAATRHGHFDSLRLLLRHAVTVYGFDKVAPLINAVDVEGNSCLHLATRLRDDSTSLSIVKVLVAHGAYPLQQNRDMETPIHMCCANALLRTLIYVGESASMGLNTNVFEYCDAEGLTPLHCAAQNGAVNCIKYLLLESLASPHAQTHEGLTPLDLSLSAGHVECTEILRKHQIDVTHGTPSLHAGMASLSVSPVKTWRKRYFNDR